MAMRPAAAHSGVEGYRAMLRQARKKLAPERIIMSEENAECWMDQIDIHLVVNTTLGSSCDSPVPGGVFG